MCAAFATIPLLTDTRFGQFGLSYPSTFLIGLYTQPLGFMLLVLWYIVYINSFPRFWRIGLASVLLALTVLANFFNAITCVFFIAATILNDVREALRRSSREQSKQARRDLAAHTISPLIAFCLAVFWLVPVLSEYQYLVTRPQVLKVSEIVTAANLVWWVVAIIGVLRWARKPSKHTRPFLWACLGLAGSVFLAATISPRWFPFQAPRFIATLNFFLAVPVGYAIAGLLRLPAWFPKSRTWVRVKNWLLKKTRNVDKRKRGFKAHLGDWLLGRRSAMPRILKILPSLYLKVALAIVLVVLSFFLLERPSYDLAFYSKDSERSLKDILGFAQNHREGRYLVEIPVASSNEAAFDGRALNSYLGAQGNETLGVVFREASPNSIFFNAAVNALSAYPDTFGISSVLAEDLDFRDQPLAKHLGRARLLGTKYLVMFTYWMKNHISDEKGVKEVFNSGDWTVFELTDERLPRVRALPFKPALVVSGFSLKQRRRNEYDFVRFAEEQFADGWFDVLLVRSPEKAIDRIPEIDQFGALILDSYDCENESVAFERLQNFAQQHALILLSSDAPLLQRIRASLAGFPLTRIIDRPHEEPGEWLEALTPSAHYQSSAIRKTWRDILANLDANKEASDSSTATVNGQIDQRSIQININAPSSKDSLPVLIDTTYFPNWSRDDRKPIYAATPFFMLTFAREPVRIVYARRWIDSMGLVVSAVTLLALCGFTSFQYRRTLMPLLRVRFKVKH